MCRLTTDTRRNTLALGGLLSSSYRHTRPGEVGARGAEDVDVGTARRNGALDTLQGEAGDGDPGGGSAGWGTVLIVLLNDDAVLGDVQQRDAGISDVGNRARRVVDGLDTDAWFIMSTRRRVSECVERLPLSEFTILVSEMVTFLTMLSVRPPTDPMDTPWPP